MKRDDLLDLNDALQHPGRKIAVDVSTELPDEADIDLVRPIEGYVEAVSTGNMLLVKGEFKTKCVVECARCGSPIESEMEYEMDEQFAVEGTPSTYASDDFARVVADEPFDLFEGNSLLVENLIRQGFIVNMPMQALCQFGWEGACPEAQKRDVARFRDQGRLEFHGLERLMDEAGNEG